jgi:CTP:phosphocholine cytidylyltransferase-like protein
MPSKNNKINLKVAVYFKGNLFDEKNSNSEYLMLAMHKKLLLWVLVLQDFAALQLVELGLKPIVIERGKMYVAVAAI